MSDQPEPTQFDKDEIQRRIKEWAYTYAEHKKFCYEYFGGRADAIFIYSGVAKENSNMGSIQALDICMQLEAEFPKRIEEIINEALRHPNGLLVGIGQYVRHLRRTSG